MTSFITEDSGGFRPLTKALSGDCDQEIGTWRNGSFGTLEDTHTLHDHFNVALFGVLKPNTRMHMASLWPSEAGLMVCATLLKLSFSRCTCYTYYHNTDYLLVTHT